MLIIYCESCNLRIHPKDFQGGGAVMTGENQALCGKCASVRAPSAQAPVEQPSAPIPAVETAGVTSAPASTRTTRKTVTLTRGASDRRAGAQANQASGTQVPAHTTGTKSNKALIIGLSVGVAFLLLAGIVLMSGKKEKTAEIAQAETKTASDEVRTLPTDTPKQQPAVPQTGEVKLRESQPEQRALPSWMQSDAKPAPAAPKQEPDTQPDRAAAAQPAVEDEVIWIEDSLPQGAVPKGNSTEAAWKWVAEPKFSGNQAHCYEENAKPKGPGDLRQHYFENALPLKINPTDTLFAYVFIDPANPPKEIMMQWRFDNSWEHRSYWGDDLITFGQNFSPSRAPGGALPKAGEWVKLAVPAPTVGIDREIYLTGWSFDNWGGMVYWDKAGVQRGAKTATVAQAAAAPAEPPKPAPAKASSQPTVEKAAVAALKPGDSGVVASFLWKDLKGGVEYHNFYNKVKSSKAIWAKTTTMPTLSAEFNLAEGRYGSGAVIIESLHQGGNGQVLIEVLVNGQQIFNGPNPVTSREWTPYRFDFAAGILKAGANKLVINNVEPHGHLNQEPWYMVHAVTVEGSLLPDFPPLLSEAQKSHIQLYANAFEQLAKKDQEISARIDTVARMSKVPPVADNALARSQAESRGETPTKLVTLAEKGQALYAQALDNFRKNPPKTPVSVEKMKLTGVIARVDGNRAFVKSQGIEMPVEISALPIQLLQNALALDESKPAGAADKALWLMINGEIEGAQQALKKIPKDAQPQWAGVFEERREYERLAKFESAVQDFENALKNLGATEVKNQLAALKKDYADLVDANKDLFAYYANLAEKVKR